MRVTCAHSSAFLASSASASLLSFSNTAAQNMELNLPVQQGHLKMKQLEHEPGERLYIADQIDVLN